MKKIITHAIISLALLQGSMSFAEDKVECKNGVCPVGAYKQTHENTQENTVIELTVENFDAVVRNATKPIIVDFYATWCFPCKAIKPVFAELAQEETGWIFAAVDIDKNPTLKAQCGVQRIPTFVMFKNGVQIGERKGGLPKEQLREEFKRIIDQIESAISSQSN